MHIHGAGSHMSGSHGDDVRLNGSKGESEHDFSAFDGSSSSQQNSQPAEAAKALGHVLKCSLNDIAGMDSKQVHP